MNPADDLTSTSTYRRLDEARVQERIWARDHHVWKDDPTEISNRLGWLDVVDHMRGQVSDLTGFAKQAVADGIQHVVLLGMGGSSLGPEVLRATLGHADGYPSLTVLDTTIPARILDAERSVDLARTLFLVSSKSGTTVEPLSLYAHFRHQVERAVGPARAGRHFAAVTDPGTPLEKLGNEQGFRRVFGAQSDIGGRYSVLSHFGMVPAALCGLPISEILESAASAMRESGSSKSLDESPGGRLGAQLAAAAYAGRNKVTLVAEPEVSAFGLWAEQLLAESTGKEGTGAIPVAGEPLLEPEAYSGDRVFVHVSAGREASPDTAARLRALGEAGHPMLATLVERAQSIGALFFEWEFATAVLGAGLQINPFDQPNVQEAKDQTTAVLKEYSAKHGLPPLEDVGSLGGLLQGAKAADYLAIMPFTAQSPELDAALDELRQKVMGRHRIATTVGYGPRFLHSTGQLHKGGPNSVLAFQITQAHQEDVEIPGQPYSFATLADAQAIGDFQALKRRERRVARLHVHGDPAVAVRDLTASL